MTGFLVVSRRGNGITRRQSTQGGISQRDFPPRRRRQSSSPGTVRTPPRYPNRNYAPSFSPSQGGSGRNPLPWKWYTQRNLFHRPPYHSPFSSRHSFRRGGKPSWRAIVASERPCWRRISLTQSQKKKRFSSGSTSKTQ